MVSFTILSSDECMNSLIISLKPTRPRWIPSGLMIMNVRSFTPTMFDEQESSWWITSSIGYLAVDGETKVIMMWALPEIVQIARYRGA